MIAVNRTDYALLKCTIDQLRERLRNCEAALEERDARLFTTPPPQARGDMVLVPRELPSSVIIDGDRIQPPIGYGNSWREYYEKWWSNILSSLAAAPGEGSGA